MGSDPSGPELEPTRSLRPNVCVRDVSWHSQVCLLWPQTTGRSLMMVLQEPVIMSAGWESGRGGSIVARHQWKGLSKLPGALEDWVEKTKQEQSDNSLRRSSRLQGQARGQRVPGAFETSEEED